MTDDAIEARKRALGALPVEDLTPAEQKRRDQCNSELEAKKAKLENLRTSPKQPEGAMVFRPHELDQMPR